MPWKIAIHIPIVKNALPSRFTNYAFLAVSLIVAKWLSAGSRRRLWRIIVAIVLIFSFLPDLNASNWLAATNVPPFFDNTADSRAIHPDETIVTIPYGIRGDAMLWQAVAGMSFRMAGGYTGHTPREFERWPIVNALMTATLIPDAPVQLAAFITVHDATVVVVDDNHRDMWAEVLEVIDPAPQHIGGVWLYRADPARLTPYHDIKPIVMEQRNDEARFLALLAAARDYLAGRYDLSALTPARAQSLHLLPPNWVSDPDVRTNNGLYLGPWNDSQIAVGVVGSYEALKPLIAKYRTPAVKLFFPFPKELAGEPTGDTFMRLLVMVFDRSTLAKMPTLSGGTRAGQ
jgi:hypothetical protein